MKKKIKKLDLALQVVEPSPEKRAVALVYLSIVQLGFKIEEAAAYFNLPYNKVQYALSLLGVKLNKSASFKKKMQKAVQVYLVDINLKLVA